VRQIANKWAKFRVLNRHSDIAMHIPDTRFYSIATMRRMLQKYGFVVVKPLRGTGGNGVIKIEQLSGNRYRYHYERKRNVVPSLTQLLRLIDRIRKDRRYLIQRGVNLVTVAERPVDYRVKMVKSGSTWRLRAFVARVARSGQFVTNLCRGGSMRQGYAALRHSFPKDQAKDKKETMLGVARKGTLLLEKKYPGIDSLGFDFGVDRGGKIWIFEVNTKPH